MLREMLNVLVSIPLRHTRIRRLEIDNAFHPRIDAADVHMSTRLHHQFEAFLEQTIDQRIYRLLFQRLATCEFDEFAIVAFNLLDYLIDIKIFAFEESI